VFAGVKDIDGCRRRGILGVLEPPTPVLDNISIIFVSFSSHRVHGVRLPIYKK
jgi:hypothetical protein